MFLLFQKYYVWWGMAFIFLSLFLIANFPKANVIESFPWLIFAAFCITLALIPAGNIDRAWHSVVATIWKDKVMRWHCIAALILSALTIPLAGVPGILPTYLTFSIFNPTKIFSGLPTIRSQNFWPFLILTNLAWPWAFPLAWFLRSYGVGCWGWTIYGATVVVWWVGVTLICSLLTIGKLFFWTATM